MALWDTQVLCLMFLLTGAVSQRVIYSDPVCGVRGSTVTLPCTFTPNTVAQDGGEVLVEITRVLWCQNHQICQGSTPTVYDNTLLNNPNNPRYRYLGDTKGNCTLQISGLKEEDDATLRFRMEDEQKLSFYAGQPGVRLTVDDETQMKILSSRDGELERGEAVALTCTTECSFHQLEVTWFRDGHALPYTGPSLHLGPLKAEDSGNYTCDLKNTVGTLSHPFSLNVEAGEEEQNPHTDCCSVPLIVGVVVGVLLALCSLILALCIIRRYSDKNQSAVREEAGPKPDDDVSSNVQQGGAIEAEDDVSYAPIQFRARSQARPVEEADDAIIYSSVVGRG
ncbi:cell adhesion molecule CEACAM1-like isoform 1-T1 [Lycodopsis pacificus]